MNFIYDIPQECGTRSDNLFVSVTDGKIGLSIIGSDDFAFSYHDFALDNLITARHRNELKIMNLDLPSFSRQRLTQICF